MFDPNNRWLAALAAKIETEAALAEIENEYGTMHPNGDARERFKVHTPGGRLVAETPWWLRREHGRMSHGIYEQSEVTMYLNRCYLGMYAPHCSKEDPVRIAYTASVEDGLRDKQLVTSLGKFLRKYAYGLSDRTIASLEATHRSEVSGTFLLATTPKDIQRVYRTMDGDSGCMRHAATEFGLYSSLHPSHVYAAPGMGVAYTVASAGDAGSEVVKSRCVVWVNPADPEDKRMVRIYGDPVLGKILDRAGYRFKDLSGAKLALIPWKDKFGEVIPDRYVVPYLDGPQGTQSTHDGSYVALDEDERYLKVLTYEQALSMQSEMGDGVAKRAKSTSAAVALVRPVKETWVSELTGVTFCAYLIRKVTVYDFEGKRTVQAERSEIEKGFTGVRTFIDGERESVYVRNGTPTFGYDGSTYVDTDENRAEAGYVKLSALYYPGEQGWTNKLYARFATDVAGTDNQHWIKAKDTIAVLPKEGGVDYMHRSMLAELRKSGYINCVAYCGLDTVIHRSRETLRRTDGGTTFCKDTHWDKYAELYDGTWVRNTGLSSISLFGKDYMYKSTTPLTTVLPDLTIIEGFKATSKGKSIVALMEQCGQSLDAATAVTAGVTVRSLAGSVIRTHVGCYSMIKLSNRYMIQGVDNAGWEDMVKCANAYAADPLEYNGMRLVLETWSDAQFQLFVMVVRAVDTYIREALATLTRLQQTAEMEAAGQVRIDDPALIAAEPQPVEPEVAAVLAQADQAILQAAGLPVDTTSAAVNAFATA